MTDEGADAIKVGRFLMGIKPREIVVVAWELLPDHVFYYFVDGKRAGALYDNSPGWAAVKETDSGEKIKLGVWLTRELADEALRDAL